MILRPFSKRMSDDWIVSKTARLLFGGAAALILILTGVFCLPFPANPAIGTRVLFGIVGVGGGLSIFFLWSGMWRYWTRCDRSSRFARRLWFVVLLVGVCYGAIIYYLSVYLPNTGARAEERIA
jgi:uncharacterized membrane-anchored protein